MLGCVITYIIQYTYIMGISQYMQARLILGDDGEHSEMNNVYFDLTSVLYLLSVVNGFQIIIWCIMYNILYCTVLIIVQWSPDRQRCRELQARDNRERPGGFQHKARQVDRVFQMDALFSAAQLSFFTSISRIVRHLIIINLDNLLERTIEKKDGRTNKIIC